MKISSNGKAAILFRLGAMIIYLVMVLGTLRYLTDLAMVQPYDLRPAGYSQADAAVLSEALGERWTPILPYVANPSGHALPGIVGADPDIDAAMACRQVRTDADDPDRRTFGNPGCSLRLSRKPRDRLHAIGWSGVAPYADTRSKHCDNFEVRFDVSYHTRPLRNAGTDLVPAIFRQRPSLLHG